MRSPAETRWLWRFAIFAALITTVPYLVAFARAGTDWVFTGFLFAVDDGNSYIAKMLSGTYGAWAFRSPYSTFPQNGLFGVYLQYLLLGKLAGGAEIHLQLVILFHLFRIAASLMYVFGSYGFMAIFLERPERRKLGTVLATVGGGLGWLLALAGQGSLFGSLPLDFYSPEAFGFLGVLGLPHLAAGRALTLWGFVSLFGPDGDPSTVRGLRAGLLWLAAGLFNPLAPVIALLVAGVYGLLFMARPAGGDRSGTVRMFAAAGLVALPPVLYNAAATIFDPFLKAWSAQNTILSPHPVHYLAAYAIYLPWAIVGARRLISSGVVRNRLPVIWVLISAALIYVPINLQRRLSEGIFISLLILFVTGLQIDGAGASVARRRMLSILAAVPTTLLLIAGAARTAWNPGEPAFRTAAEVAVFDFLADEAPPGSVVLAPVSAGNALPAFAPVRVVIGHGPETIEFDRLRPVVEAFFDGRLSGAAATAFLAEQRVDYVFWPGAAETVYPDLELVYTAAGFQIFRVPR